MAVGRFITLEGVDGSGKSTQAELLADALEAGGRTVVRAREPGGTPLGEDVRGLLLHSAPGAMGAVAEACLFAASRAELVRLVVRPALADGAWVVCDRFLESSLAYQGAGRGVGLDAVRAINRASVDGCVPDLTVLIDVPVRVAAARRSAGPDRIEAEGEAFQRRVADGYRALTGDAGGRIVAVDGDAAPGDVHARVMAAVRGALG